MSDSNLNRLIMLVALILTLCFTPSLLSAGNGAGRHNINFPGNTPRSVVCNNLISYKSRSIYNVEPQTAQEVSMARVLLLDLFVPGGGHFYRGDYYLGAAFVLLKSAGAYAVYYTYNEWKYYRSLYRSARKADSEIDADHELRFEHNGSYLTVEQLKHKYDNAAQMITFSVLANVVIYSVSMIINYQAVESQNSKAVPLFETGQSFTITPDGKVTFSYRIAL